MKELNVAQRLQKFLHLTDPFAVFRIFLGFFIPQGDGRLGHFLQLRGRKGDDFNPFFLLDTGQSGGFLVDILVAAQPHMFIQGLGQYLLNIRRQLAKGLLIDEPDIGAGHNKGGF